MNAVNSNKRCHPNSSILTTFNQHHQRDKIMVAATADECPYSNTHIDNVFLAVLCFLGVTK